MTQLVSNPLLPILPPSHGTAPAVAIAGEWPAASDALPRERAGERWTRWLAKGASHDRVMRRRFQLIAWVIFFSVTIYLASTL